jgi:hypothetical protein
VPGKIDWIKKWLKNDWIISKQNDFSLKIWGINGLNGKFFRIDNSIFINLVYTQLKCQEKWVESKIYIRNEWIIGKQNVFLLKIRGIN